MEIVNRKRAVSLGIRVGVVFLIAIATIIIAAYYVVSQNFQSLLTDYTIKLIESMTDQGVKMVETELEIGRQEISFLAGSFQIPDSKEKVTFPKPYTKSGNLRMVYVTEDKTISSDDRQRDIRKRPDIRAAFAGGVEVYGPYFNEENEYVVCYSAPVKQDNDIVGVLSVEKDGYQFCEIIENIRFVDSGESYIINAEGTDIAVSDQNHIDWVNTQYNAQKLYEGQADEETKSIIELEQKGLKGETGIGTYYWEGGLCYVFYQPIPSMDWVLLAGLREEELASMTQSVLSDSVSNGPIVGICLFLVLFLTALIIYWIISSMKKTAEINEKLKLIASYDSLTGLLNRNSFHTTLDLLTEEETRSLSCIYIDANGLHEVNNHLGHQAGDQMLKAIADALRSAFGQDGIYRIGGDEFVVLCREKKEEVSRISEQVRTSLHSQNYEISMGIAWWKHNSNAMGFVNEAEAAMQQDKRQFYANIGNERHMRSLDERMEQIMIEKKDADTFLTVLAPEFKGVYVVNLSRDTVRHIFIPPYFEECLRETDAQFSKALILYAKKMVEPEYIQNFQEICDYSKLKEKLDRNDLPELIYQKTNGDWLKMRILKFRDYTDRQQQTLWIFTNVDSKVLCPDGIV